MRTHFIFIAVICVLLFFAPTQAFSQETILPLNVTLSPATLQINTEPGEAVTATVRVLNNNPTPETLRVKFGGFSADGSGEKPVLFDFSSEHPQQNWLTAQPSVITVEPFSWQTVELTFHPENIAAFGYYYSVMFERTNNVPTDSTNPVVGIPAILLLASVESPHMLREAELVDFTSTKKWYEFLPSEFSVSVRNTGNVHVAPIGNIFVHKGATKNIAVLDVNRARGYILPNSTRTFSTQWNDGFPAYRPVINENGTTEKNPDGTTKYKLEWNPNFSTAFRFGKFTANLVIVYDNGQRDIPLEKTIEFWVIPWKLLLLFGVILLLLITGLFTPVVLIGKKVLKKRH